MEYQNFNLLPTEIENIYFFYSTEHPLESKAINIQELEAEAIEAQNSLDNMNPPTDEELLAWARLHYPFIDNSEDRAKFEDTVARWNKVNELLNV